VIEGINQSLARLFANTATDRSPHSGFIADDLTLFSCSKLFSGRLCWLTLSMRGEGDFVGVCACTREDAVRLRRHHFRIGNIFPPASRSTAAVRPDASQSIRWESLHFWLR